MVFGYGEFHTAMYSTAETNLAWGTLLLVTGFAQFVGSFGLFALARWVFVPPCLLSALGRLGFPYGTTVHGLMLYLVLCPEGRRVLRKDYKRIVGASKGVERERSNAIAWVFLIMIMIAATYLLCMANAPW